MRIVLSILFGLSLIAACQNAEPPGAIVADVAEKKPNILLVMADDMGWTDLGSFGSAIDTPRHSSAAVVSSRERPKSSWSRAKSASVRGRWWPFFEANR